jgi:hypothetical protein
VDKKSSSLVGRLAILKLFAMLRRYFIDLATYLAIAAAQVNDRP